MTPTDTKWQISKYFHSLSESIYNTYDHFKRCLISVVHSRACGRFSGNSMCSRGNMHYSPRYVIVIQALRTINCC